MERLFQGRFKLYLCAHYSLLFCLSSNEMASSDHLGSLSAQNSLTYITVRKFGGGETHGSGLEAISASFSAIAASVTIKAHSVVPETHHCLPDVSSQSSLWDLRSTERKCTCMAAKFFCSCEGAWWTNRSQLAWRGLLASRIYNTSPLLPRTWKENNNHTSCQTWTATSSPVDMWSGRAERSLRHPIPCTW